MSSLAGTPQLVRLYLRRDRIRIPVWILAILVFVLSTASSVEGLYPTRADLAAAAEVIASNPTQVALNGPALALDTLGGRTTWEIGATGLVIVALMSIFLVGRHTRAEEESGRLELVRSAVVGRYAPVVAALTVAVAVNAVLAILITFGLMSYDLPPAGSIGLALSLTSAGIVFAAVTVVAAQVTEHARGVYGMAAAALGVAYTLRAIGDVGDGTLSWLSPIGWGQAIRPFADERWWPLLLAAGFSAVLVAIALKLIAIRDVGAGLVHPRPGPARASGILMRPVGLAVRLQRGSLIGWIVGLFLLGAAYGSIGTDVEDMLRDSPDLSKAFSVSGATLTDSFFAAILLVLALIGSGYAIQSTLRLRGEENAGRAEPVLATALSRWRWVGSYLTVALGGTVAVVGAGGLGAGLAFGYASGDLGVTSRLLGAALVQVPAVWVLIGVAVALFGLFPRGAHAAWGALAACVVFGMFGQLFEFPNWLMNASPFQHVPQLPAAEFDAIPVLLLVAVAAGLILLGLAGFRRRDVVTT
jgi:ABC-2 type transport system permease protein